MRNKITSALLSLMFLGILANAQNGYQSAREKVKIGGKQIIAKSEIYLNLMPQSIEDKPVGKVDCSKSGTLIAPVTIETFDNSKLPKGIEIIRVWMKNNDGWRQIQFNRNERSIKETSINSVARACPNYVIKPEGKIIAAVEVKYRGKNYFVRTSQVKLEVVY